MKVVKSECVQTMKPKDLASKFWDLAEEEALSVTPKQLSRRGHSPRQGFGGLRGTEEGTWRTRWAAPGPPGGCRPCRRPLRPDAVGGPARALADLRDHPSPQQAHSDTVRSLLPPNKGSRSPGGSPETGAWALESILVPGTCNMVLLSLAQVLLGD